MRLRLALLATVLFAAPASAQITCTSDPIIPREARAEGITELVSDWVLRCKGGVGGGNPFLANWQIILNTNVTSRLLSGAANEALMLIDEPAGNGVLGTPGVIPGGTVYQGLQQVPIAIVWTGVPFTPPAAGQERVIRITNVRANASRLGVSDGSDMPTQIVGIVSVSGAQNISIDKPQLTLALIRRGVEISARSGADPAVSLGGSGFPARSGAGSGPPTAAPAGYLRFTEGFAGAFRVRGSDKQTTPGTNYETESGYSSGLSDGLPGAGRADFGTRLRVQFAGIPRGVRAWVGLTDRSGRAVMILSESLPFVPRLQDNVFNGISVGEIPIVGGAGYATWEVVSADPKATESLDFPIFLQSVGDVASGTITGLLAPTSTFITASSVLAVPRFVSPTNAATFPVTVGGPLSAACTPVAGPGRVAVPYSADCTALLGVPPYKWSITAGSLPNGVELSPTSGAAVKISGAPFLAGPYSYSVTVTDSGTPPQTASVAFSGTIAERLANEMPGSATTIAVGAEGSVYITGTTSCDNNGCPPYKWDGGAFQRIAGSGQRVAVDKTGRFLLLNKNGGLYYYDSPTSQNSSPIADSATDVAAGADGSLYIVGSTSCTEAAGCAPARYNGAAFEPMQGRAVRIAADSTGKLWTVDKTGAIFRYRSADKNAAFDPVAGAATAITASADGDVYIVGTAPCDGAGCTVYKFNGASFAPIDGLTGVEIAADKKNVLWLVTKTGKILRYAPDEEYRVTCNPTTGPTATNIPYSTTCEALNRRASVDWSISSGALPAGLSLAPDFSSATISGTPTATGDYRFTVTGRDTFIFGGTGSVTFSGTITAGPAPMTVSCTPAAGPAIAGAAYSTTCTAANGVAPVTWSLTFGALPTGLTMSGTTGSSITISGTPTAAGNYSFTLTVKDGPGRTGVVRFSGTIGAAARVSISCAPGAGPAAVGANYSSTCTAANGLAPYRWTVSAGTLPAGLSLGPTTGATTTISGTPTAVGAYSFTVTVTDSSPPSQTASQTISGTLAARLTFTCSPAAGPIAVNVPYSTTCTAANGAAPYRWAVVPGTLPSGLTLSGGTGASVTISGISTAAGAYNYTLALTDSSSPAQTATLVFSGTLVVQAIRITNAASFAEGTVARDAIATIYGAGLALRTESYNGTAPTTLGGTSVKVTDSQGVARDAPLFFAADTQINFLIPADTAPGPATVAVTKQGSAPVTGTVMVANVAPGIFVVRGNSTVPAAFYLRDLASGEILPQAFTFDPNTLEAATIPRAPGDRLYLILYGTGFRRSSTFPIVTVNGQNTPLVGVAAHAVYAGLDQINVGPLPASLPSGLVTVRIDFNRSPANDITVRLQ